MIESRECVFRVACKLEAEETVCVVGNCDALGNWDSQRMIRLHAEMPEDEDGEEPVWSGVAQLPLHEVEFRYCVAIILEAKPGIHDRAIIIRRWETNLLPRKIPKGVTTLDPSADKFGSYGGFERVDQGWLVKDSVVQLRFCSSNLHNDPVMLFKRKYQNKNVRVKITPVELNKISPQEPPIGGLEESTDFDLSNLRIHNRPVWPITEIAVMKENHCKFKPQDQFGTVCNNGDYVVFQCRMLNTESNAFLCDFYLEGTSEEIPQYLGCSYILPSNMKANFGVVTLPITSAKHIPVGQLTVHYMVVHPTEYGGDMSISYARHWKDSWKGLEVGHRGAGNSYHSQPKSCANIRENTVASLKYAADIGADMVELDVQLSKDLVPVIYHDFHACIALKRKKEHDQTDLLEIPIKDLTLSQLQALKVFHKTERGLSRFRDEDFEDHQPFPTMQRALEAVPHTCGFNVEVKWTMQMRDGTYELQHPFELNHFLDLIIKEILEYGGKRKIVFSCFHPDICTMLRFKQNRYPVMFLTQGVSDVWPPYEDQRTTTIHHAILYATNADILGINVHTEDLIRDSKQMQMALDHNLVVFCWGDDNNDQETIKFLKNLGLHGIIYDKIDVYNTKEKKESVFLCEERESSKAMINAANDSHFNGSGNDSDVSGSPESTLHIKSNNALSNSSDKKNNGVDIVHSNCESACAAGSSPTTFSGLVEGH